MYYDQQTMYGQKEFKQFLNIIEHSIDDLYHAWLFYQSIGLEYVAFQFYGHTYMQYKRCTITGALNWVSKVDWCLAMQDVKKQCTHTSRVGAMLPFTINYECNWDSTRI
jgi:hypothetical protein